jgi:site-specific DNA-methyltransferase (adenine-specific)
MARAQEDPSAENVPTGAAESEQVRALLGVDGVELAEGIGLVHADAQSWLGSLPDHCVHAVVTDPPYGLIEYEERDHDKLRKRKGGVWRIPPSFDGSTRSPVPRFTVLRPKDIERLSSFFGEIATELKRVLVPGGHLMVASNPLVANWTFDAFASSGLEYRGSIIRTVQTLRGGDRPKGAHEQFPDVTVMPRSCWEPWGLFRKPCEGTVANNLRRWSTGGLRRLSAEEPFRDMIKCSPTRPEERRICSHPSLKPQRFMRQVVRASLPLGRGIVIDPFSGGGSTLAAAAAIGYAAIGVERDREYFELSASCFEGLRSHSRAQMVRDS